MSYVIGSVAYIMTKHLCIGILEKTSWNSCIVLTDSRLNHIKFWKDSLPEVNGNQFTSDLSGQSIVYIDAHFIRLYFNILTIDRRICLTAVSSFHV
jgi:hypothetical protein